MFFATGDNPYTVLTLIAAPAVFTNAASVLTLGTGNRLARVVDRTRSISQELQKGELNTESLKLWRSHLDRLERRGGLLLRAMRSFYGSIGAFAAASLVSVLGASLAASEYRTIRGICGNELYCRGDWVCGHGDRLRFPDHGNQARSGIYV